MRGLPSRNGMRRQPVVVSIAVHWAAMGLVALSLPHRAAPRGLAPSRRYDVPQHVTQQVIPIELSVVDDGPGEAVLGTRSGPTVATKRSHAGILDAALALDSNVGSVELGRGHEVAGQGLMHMRSGASLELGSEFSDGIAAAPGHRAQGGAGVPPGTIEPYHSGRVELHRDGTATVHDAVTTMTIERDGSAHFHDKPYIDIHLRLPIPTVDLDELRHDVGDLIATWYADPYAITRVGRTQDLPRHLQAVPGACDQWGNTLCEDPLAPEPYKELMKAKREVGTFAEGNLDIYAWLYRKYAGDPYASRKLKLLDDTRDERAALGEKYRANRLDASRELMQKTLVQLWRTTLDPAQRRAALFELWDECAEGEGPTGQAGEQARVVVIDWIREHLPPGSPDAYPPDELAALVAKRTSRQAFAPYAELHADGASSEP